MAEILVTGAAGFLGRHLCAELATRGHHVIAAAATFDGTPADVVPVTVDANEPTAFAEVVARLKPEVVIHAAFRNRKTATQSDLGYLSIAQAGDMPLFKACGQVGVRLILISSSAVYGAAEGRELIDETCPVRPVTIYGLAKAEQEMLAQYSETTSELKLMTVRLFNLIGPGQDLGMVMPDWVSRAILIARGAEPVLRVNNRSSARDFVDVRDAVRAISMLVDDFRPGTVLNVASGTSVNLAEISNALMTLCPRPFTVKETAPLLSSTDVPSQRGDYARLRNGWGWTPRISWLQSLRDVWQQQWTSAGELIEE